MRFIEAVKIYLSRTHYKKKGKFIKYTLGDLIFMTFVFFLGIPLSIIYIIIGGYHIKRNGIKKEYRKYYSYYTKEEKK